jgi:Caudovirales tail fibre assembly protein.
MSIFYSKKKCGFYDDKINNDFPDDVVEISRQYHSELLEKQSQGFDIKSDKNGYPVAVEHVITIDEIIMINTSKQQQLLNIANEQIIILERAIKYNRATDADKLLLEKLELFTIDVSQVDLSDPDLTFPELPKKAL